MCSADTQESNKNGWVPAEEFVNNLLTEASRIPCDETISDFNEEGLPKFYDPDKFRRAQQFFKAHIFALYFSKLLGLIVTLASPSVLKILQMTNMSSCIWSSYKRYMATLLHMNIWYESELSPNSRSMASIKKVKCLHNAASRKAKGLGMPFITQKDMVLTQFGFMGFAIARTEMIGIHDASEEDLKSLVHFWRVIGHIMGIQDRFNLCRESLEETREICDVLINKVLRPLYQKKDKDFIEMTSYLINGMWHMNPMLNERVFLTYLYEMLKPKLSNNNKHVSTDEMYFDLNFTEKLFFRFVTSVIFVLKYTLIRLYLNLQHRLSLWIMGTFPFLAIYRFGYRDAFVSVKFPQSKSHVC